MLRAARTSRGVVIARLRRFASDLGDAFWLLPAAMVAVGIGGALILIQVDRNGLVPRWLIEGAWIYNGGATGARTLLGAVGASTIGVAGTVFSITIAALSFAAGQMGPRLLHNFTRDRGNQFTLGVFLGTFAYALVVLRSIRSEEEGVFVPHLSLAVAIALAILCVATLVYFVGHMSTRINVDTVIELVSDDAHGAFMRLSVDRREPLPPPESHWQDATTLCDARSGYLQELDADGLAKWAHRNGAALRLLVRLGSFVFPGAPIARIQPPVDGALTAIRKATALGNIRKSGSDIEFAARLLVEVAVRALSPSVNDPFTAIGALDRLGASLCALAPRFLRTGVHMHEGRVVFVVPNVDYDGLVDGMFHQIRQSAQTQPAVLVRMLEVLTAIASCDADPDRRHALGRHADLVLADATRSVAAAADLTDIRDRHRLCRDALEATPDRPSPGHRSATARRTT